MSITEPSAAGPAADPTSPRLGPGPGGHGHPTFSAWLFRAYLDLGPVPPEAPHHLHGLDFGIRSLLEGRQYPRIQSALNPSFRQVLVSQVGTPAYGVADPLSLPDGLATDRWRALCDHVGGFAGLGPPTQARVAWLLNKLCFQRFVLTLLPQPVDEAIARSDADAALAYQRAYARARLRLDDPASPYSIDEFEAIAEAAPPGICQVDAHYQMVSQHVKAHGDLAAASYWQRRHREAIDRSSAELSDFEHLLVLSRYHRVGGFLPQMRQDVAGTVAEMGRAEEYAHALPRRDEAERIAADEMLYPVYESRTKEALWLGDLDLAEERAGATVGLSPYDARAWLHLGEVHCERDEPEEALAAYLRAARLAPPGREVAWFMAGQCYEQLDRPEDACDAYLASLDADPLGISAAEELNRLAAQLGHVAITRWSRHRLERLHELAGLVPEPQPEPYKTFPQPRR